MTSSVNDANGVLKNVSSMVSAFVTHKFSSPIWSAYAFSWCLFNWKSIAFFFLSEDEIGLRMGTIDLVYSGNLLEVWGYPILGALLVLGALPLLELKYKSIISGIKRGLAKVKADEEEACYKNMEGAAKAKMKILNLEAGNKKYEELLADYKTLQDYLRNIENEYQMYVLELPLFVKEIEAAQKQIDKSDFASDSRLDEVNDRLSAVSEELSNMHNRYFRRKSPHNDNSRWNESPWLSSKTG